MMGGTWVWQVEIYTFDPLDRSLVSELDLAVLFLHYRSWRFALKIHCFYFVLFFQPYLPFISPHQIDFQGSYLCITACLSCIGFEVLAREKAANFIPLLRSKFFMQVALCYSQGFPRFTCWTLRSSALPSFSSEEAQESESWLLAFLAGAYS